MKSLRWLAMALALFGGGCGARDATPAAPSVPTVAVTSAERRDVTRTITLPGDLVGNYETALHAKVTGYLRHIDVDKGDWVKAGQVLAEIEVPELEQKLQRARANLAVRSVTYDRLAGVWKSDHRLVAREDVDVALGERDEAKADVDQLEALVGYTKILAPFDGVVTARYADPGALVLGDGAGGQTAAGTDESHGPAGAGPVVSMADIGNLRVYIRVPEEEIGQVRRGMSAKLYLRSMPDRPIAGTVTRFANALDLATRTMLTEIDIDNRDHALYPGMYADVTLELERHAGVVTVPPSAVATEGDARFVYAVRDLHLVKLRIRTGLADDDALEVVSGLAEGEQVVRNVSPGLRDGETVQASRQDEPPAGTLG
jgi:membrane fusion protein, multidrug efflux system